MRTSPLQALSTHTAHPLSRLHSTAHTAHSAHRTRAGDHLRLARPHTQSTPTNSLTVSGGQERVLQSSETSACDALRSSCSLPALLNIRSTPVDEAGRPRYWRAILAIMGIPSGRPVNALWPPRTAPPRRGALHTEMDK